MGFFFLAKQVADFTGISFYEVFDRKAAEIFGTVMIAKAMAKTMQREIKNNPYNDED